MKILQLITELTPAGAEKIVCELSIALSAKKNEVSVISLMPFPQNDTILCELRNKGINVISLDLRKVSIWRICELRKLINKFQPDIVHSHLIHSNIISRITKLFSKHKFKLINTVHIAERRNNKKWHFFLDKLTFKLCDIQTCVSKTVRDYHSEKIKIDNKKMPVVYNGLPIVPQINEERICTLRKEWNVANCAKIIGSVGRLDWQKGYDLFLKHLSAICAKIPENETWAIIIIGEGKYRKELENIIASQKFDNLQVNLIGFRKDAAECIGAFDLFVMPSRYEGHPLTLVEAMFSGVGIIGSKAETIIEYGHDYSNIEFIDFNNETEVIKSIFNFIDKGKIEPLAKFTVNKMVNEYLEIYNQ